MRLGILLRVAIFLIVSLTIGIGSARWLIARSATTFPIGVGSWKIWTRDSDGTGSPYGTAHYLLAGRLPPPPNQVSIYETAEDDNGRPFDGDCVYTVFGPALGARWWEIAIIDSQSGPRFEADSHVGSASSAQVVRNADGSFIVTIAREPMPGNWISPGELSRYSVAISLRFARLRDPREPVAMLPRISRGECT